MKITVTTEIESTYTLNKEQSAKIIQYAKENKVDLEEAVDELFLSLGLNLQADRTKVSSSYECDEVLLEKDEEVLLKKHRSAR